MGRSWLRKFLFVIGAGGTFLPFLDFTRRPLTLLVLLPSLAGGVLVGLLLDEETIKTVAIDLLVMAAGACGGLVMGGLLAPFWRLTPRATASILAGPSLLIMFSSGTAVSGIEIGYRVRHRKDEQE